MSQKVLDFERPIVELEGKIRELKVLSAGSAELADKISRLEEEAAKLQRERFASLSPWETLQLAKHPDRPYTLDYIDVLMNDFVELRGTGPSGTTRRSWAVSAGSAVVGCS